VTTILEKIFGVFPTVVTPKAEADGFGHSLVIATFDVYCFFRKTERVFVTSFAYTLLQCSKKKAVRKTYRTERSKLKAIEQD